MIKPFSQACEENSRPILGQLLRLFADSQSVLEIGSGTGQHAVFFAASMPWLEWQPSDCAQALPGIAAWAAEMPSPNLRPAVVLDVSDRHWPRLECDAVFSANTAHILSWEQVEHMFQGVARVLPEAGLFVLYGPFKEGGSHISESNQRFDHWLRQRDPLSGVRDLDDLIRLATDCGLEWLETCWMPANNRLAVWRRAGR